LDTPLSDRSTRTRTAHITLMAPTMLCAALRAPAVRASSSAASRSTSQRPLAGAATLRSARPRAPRVHVARRMPTPVCAAAPGGGPSSGASSVPPVASQQAATTSWSADEAVRTVLNAGGAQRAPAALLQCA
jgi:hypothetical protein